MIVCAFIDICIVVVAFVDTAVEGDEVVTRSVIVVLISGIDGDAEGNDDDDDADADAAIVVIASGWVGLSILNHF